MHPTACPAAPPMAVAGRDCRAMTIAWLAMAPPARPLGPPARGGSALRNGWGSHRRPWPKISDRRPTGKARSLSDVLLLQAIELQLNDPLVPAVAADRKVLKSKSGATKSTTGHRQVRSPKVGRIPWW